MGRNNRSRKRRDEMNKIKKARYEAKELIRLKKTLGLLDADGNEIMKDISDVVEIKTAKELKRVSYVIYPPTNIPIYLMYYMYCMHVICEKPA